MHRVPFGEYVPLKEWLPFMKMFAPYDYDYSVQRGEKFTRFKIPNPGGPANPKHENFVFGVLICYEDTDPFLARNYLETGPDGPPVDFLVNISNDGWFDGSSEHEEHLAVSRFRAIECRRALVRSVNMGISALIDGNGRVLKPSLYPDGTPPVWVVREVNNHVPELPVAEWHKFKNIAGILTAAIPIDRRFSFYVLAGDWLPIGCWLGLGAAMGWSWLRRKHSLASTSANRFAHPGA
jgi:apolipoprotein N-acyltransferase